MTYEFTVDAPQKPNSSIYAKKAIAKLNALLETSASDEAKFQDFLSKTLILFLVHEMNFLELEVQGIIHIFYV